MISISETLPLQPPTSLWLVENDLHLKFEHMIVKSRELTTVVHFLLPQQIPEAEKLLKQRGGFGS